LTSLKIMKLWNSCTTFLISFMQRQGKTYAVGQLILDYFQQYKRMNVLIITPVPNETITQFTNDLFLKYNNFKKFNVITLNSTNVERITESISTSYNNIIVCSKQFIQRYVLDKSINYGIRFDLIVFDENHFGGTTDISQSIYDSYKSDITRFVFLTATYNKPLHLHHIQDEGHLRWTMEDIQLCKKRDVKQLIKIHGEEVKRFLNEENCQEVLSTYDIIPDLCMFTWTLTDDKYRKLKVFENENVYGYSNNTLFSMNEEQTAFIYVDDVAMMFRLLTGSSKEEDYPNGDMSIFGRIKQYSLKHGSRTFRHTPQTILFFLPHGKGMNIENVSRCTKEIMLQNSYLKHYEIMILNGKEKYSYTNLKLFIRDKEHQAMDDGKNGLIVLLGEMCVLGITLPNVDIIVMWNDWKSSDKFMQAMMRCFTESMDGLKKFGFVVDMKLNRIIESIIQYNTPHKFNTSKEKITYVIEHNLISINPDVVVTKENKTQLVSKLHEMWMKYAEDNVYVPINKLMNVYNSIAYDRRFDTILDTINLSISKDTSTKKSQTQVDEEVDQFVKSGQIISKTNSNTLTLSKTQQSIQQHREDKMKMITYVLPQVIMVLSICTIYDNQMNDLETLLYYIITTDDILKRAVYNKLNIMNNCKDFNDQLMSVLLKLSKEFKNIRTVNDIIGQIKFNIMPLIDDPLKALQYIGDILKPRTNEKRKFGEVNTPITMIHTMMSYIFNYVTQLISSGKMNTRLMDLKILDPACGTGNFAIATYYILMGMLKNDIPEYEMRKCHILENMLYVSEINISNLYIFNMIINPNGIYKLNIHNGDSLKLNTLVQWKTKVDIVCGNPPYQEDFSNTADPHAKPVYHKFVTHFVNQSQLLTFIIPSKWFSSQDKQLLTFKKLMLESGKLVYLTHREDAKSVFSNVDIKGGVCNFLYDNTGTFTGQCQLNGITFNHEFDIPVKTEYVELVRSIQNICNTNGNLSSLYHNQSEFGINSNDERVVFTIPLTSNKNMYYKCVMSSKGKSFRSSGSKIPIGYILKTSVSKYKQFWKVITYSASFSGSSGFGSRFIGDQNTVYSKSCISFSVNSQEEAYSLFSYMNTKFVNFMLSLRKLTHNITNAKISSWIPIVPFNRQWTDEYVFDYLNIPVEIHKIIFETPIKYNK